MLEGAGPGLAITPAYAKASARQARGRGVDENKEEDARA